MRKSRFSESKKSLGLKELMQVASTRARFRIRVEELPQKIQ